MSELVADCPRCGAKEMTFDLKAAIFTHKKDWQRWYEAFCICRACNKSTVFVLFQKDNENRTIELLQHELKDITLAVNQALTGHGYISQKDVAAEQPPEHLPENVEAAFREGAACAAIGCFNAAATMFRLCIDLSTKAMLPAGDAPGLNGQVRRSLGLRLPWLFDNDKLPEPLRELSACIKDDGNDGAHEGTLSEEDAEDILDFATVLLERIYTEPKRLELARERRQARRADSGGQ